MAYLLRNIYSKNYWNRSTIVEIIVGGWVVSFFETQCILKALLSWGMPVTLPMPWVTLLQWHRHAASWAGCRVWQGIGLQHIGL